MNRKFKEILEWVRDEIPELLDLDHAEEGIDPDSNIGRACQMFSKATLLLNPHVSECPEEFLPVLTELNRIAPEQGWSWEPDCDGHLAANSGCTEIAVEVGDCSLSKRIRYKWTVITIGPCDFAHDAPAPSVDEVFTSNSEFAVARRAAAEDYTATIQYA